MLVVAAPAPAYAAVTVGGASVTEGNAAATVTFTVTRTAGLLTGPATVHFATADGSARAPADYDAVFGDLQFGSLPLGGTQVQTVPVTVRGDRLDEADETFRLVLSGSAEIVAGQGEGLATIADDDPPPVVGVSDAPPAGESGVATFTVSLSAVSGRDVSVAFGTADGSAVAGEDYVARTGTLGIPAGAASATVAVALLDDVSDEADEGFELRIGSPVFATIGRAAGAATIIDDDEPPAPAPPVSSSDAPSAPIAGVPPAGGPPGDLAEVSADPVATNAGRPLFGLSSPRLRRPSIVLVTVSCPRQTSRCRGRVTIFSRPNPRSKVKALRRQRRLGRRNFTLNSGATRTLTIALSRADRVLLTRTGRMLVRAYAVTTDGAGRVGVRRSTGTLIARTTHT
jgi:hypothetical protein